MAEKESKDSRDFTPRELEIMAKAWNCFTEEPKVNYESLAEACGMSNPRSASNAWAKIKTKIMAKGTSQSEIYKLERKLTHWTAGITKGEGDENDGEGSAKKRSTPRKRGKATEPDADDGESPTKKAKGGKKGKASKEAKAEADAEELDEDAGEPVKPEPEEED